MPPWQARRESGLVIMSALLSIVLATTPLVSSSVLALAPPEGATEEVQPDEAEEDDDERRVRRTKGLVLRGYAKAGSVALPGVGFGGGVGIGYLRNRFRFDVIGSGRLDRSAWYPSGNVGGDFSLFRAGMRACLVLGSDRVATPICGGADAGMVTARGVGTSNPRTERQPWASAFADIDLAWHVMPRLALITTSRWLVPLVRRQYYVGDRGTLVTTPPFGVEVGLGLEVVLP